MRGVVRDIGYTSSEYGFDADTCAVIVALDKQSPDIAQGVDAALETRATGDALDRIGAGDQGMMFGFACDETPELMPLPIMLAHAARRERLAARAARRARSPYLRPDGKAQVTVRVPARRRARRAASRRRVVVSTQHRRGVDIDELRADIIEHVIKPRSRPSCSTTPRSQATSLVNPTGRFVVGGPMGDAGLTGRKIIVDTYGGMARHGGGAFSGKDPTKVDRSAATPRATSPRTSSPPGLARALRGAGRLRDRRRASGDRSCVDTFGTHRVDPDAIERAACASTSTCARRAIMRDLDLRRPIYRATAAYGHFGRDEEDSPGSAPIAPTRWHGRSAPARRTPEHARRDRVAFARGLRRPRAR